MKRCAKRKPDVRWNAVPQEVERRIAHMMNLMAAELEGPVLLYALRAGAKLRDTDPLQREAVIAGCAAQAAASVIRERARLLLKNGLPVKHAAIAGMKPVLLPKGEGDE